ncbi:MerC domain-containing protein [Olivibacter sitiensis]|uniref:MerC domain-containing protein n=1 Tax=Olivibacter sitiensis TaxID=376470 RepID=UPI0003F79200|nr:MerC domain-containing protein [Olivibacter sitiensis]
MKMIRKKISLDHLGFTASALCAVHCAVMPFVITFLPLIGLDFLSKPWFELGVSLLSVAIGVSALVPAYLKVHRNRWPMFLLTIGLGLIMCVHFLGYHHIEFVLMPIGGFSIASAHYINWKLSRTLHGHALKTDLEK